MPKLTKRILDAAKPVRARDVFLWCSEDRGFGARIYPTGRVCFITQVRVGRTQRRVKIGAYGAFTVEQAREVARRIIRAASEGRDPQREKQDRKKAVTVSELCDLYLEAGRAGRVLTRFGRPKRPSTLAIDVGRIVRHIKPLLGRLTARDVTAGDVQRMADAIAGGKTAGTIKTGRRGKAVVKGGPVTAARVVELLGGIWTWAAKRDLVSSLSITRGVDRTKTLPKDRTLSADELRRLGMSIQEAREKSPLASLALSLIALTGSRREEIVGLKWAEVDLAASCLRLDSTKTGRSTRPLGNAVADLLRACSLNELHPDYLFPNSRNDGPADLKKAIARIFNDAGLTDARSHDLRRTFATTADELGYSEASIGEILGHARRSVTGRHYIRRPDAALIAAATRISDRIAAALNGDFGASVLDLGRHNAA